MTRKELVEIISQWIYDGIWTDICMQNREEEIIDDIMEYVDKYVLSCVMELTEFKVNKIEPGQPLFPVPTCPKCGSTYYKIDGRCSAGNCHCQNCGNFYFHNFSSSI